MGFTRNEITTNDMFLHVYSDMSKEDLDRKVDQLMESQGYKKLEEQNGQMIYERGNRVLRLLFGAFVKYSKVKVQTIASAPNEVKCELRSQSTGMSGGLIGVNQVKKEINHLFGVFQVIQ